VSQKELNLGPLTTAQRANKISRAASKKRRRLPVLQPSLPVADDAFTPLPGVPRTRADCPTTGICPYVRCRFHLLHVSAENRAGRPGLANVPRDAAGLTLPSPGDAGADRPGTTLHPAWLKVRGLEVEREVKVYVTAEYELHELRNGTLDYFLAHVHPGEPLLAYDTVTLGLGDEPLLLARAEVTADKRVKFDRELPEYVINGSSALLLRRVRGISSCALDEIDRHGKMTNEQVGDALHRHRTLVARENKEALKKAARKAEEMDVDVEDFVRALKSWSNGE
jgi:hypothetical protein